jgi:hypothetical protein
MRGRWVHGQVPRDGSVDDLRRAHVAAWEAATRKAAKQRWLT